jgi:hypothetical protein
MIRLKMLLIVALPLTLLSCDAYLDVNTNPNSPAEVTARNLLPTVEASTIARLGNEGALIGTFWMQYATQGNTTNQYNTLANYSLTASSYQNIWSNAYSNTLSDIRIMLERAEVEKVGNFWFMGKVLEAYNLHILMEWYGDIPFTERNNSEEFPQPKYDDSKTVVYPGILALLDEALSREDFATQTSNPTIGAEDYFFHGDMVKWIAFAKTLKLKLLLRDFDANRSLITSLVAAGGLLDEDCAFTAFQNSQNKGNPFYETNIRQLNTRENVRACHTFTEFLLANNDPRIADFYEVSSDFRNSPDASPWERYGGLPCGTKPPSERTEKGAVILARSSRFLQAYSDPVYLMNAAEIAFMLAEVYARTGDKANAKLHYDDGVTRAFRRYGYDASGHIAAGGVYSFDDRDEDSMMTSIMTQKWVAACKANAWDAFFDRNRTGIPAISRISPVRVDDTDYTLGLTPGYVLGTLVPPGGTVLLADDFPHRLIVPQNSQVYNPNAPAAVSIREPLWWHKQ